MGRALPRRKLLEVSHITALLRSKRQQKSGTRKLNLEALESRRLMAGSIELNGGVLEIEGTSGDDGVEITYLISGGILTKVNLYSGGQTQTQYYLPWQINSIVFHGGDGDDYFRNDTDARCTAYGEFGNDTLGGGLGNDVLDGGFGDDQIWGRNGNDTLRGSYGNDYLDGGNGNDSITGSYGQDTVFGFAGDDTISGGYGDDYLVGGDNNDRMYGDSGRDTMFGQQGMTPWTADLMTTRSTGLTATIP